MKVEKYQLSVHEDIETSESIAMLELLREIQFHGDIHKAKENL